MNVLAYCEKCKKIFDRPHTQVDGRMAKCPTCKTPAQVRGFGTTLFTKNGKK